MAEIALHCKVGVSFGDDLMASVCPPRFDFSYFFLFLFVFGWNVRFLKTVPEAGIPFNMWLHVENLLNTIKSILVKEKGKLFFIV